MQRRQPLPRLWLMTDERQGEKLWKALKRLPRGSGVVFRHYSLERVERNALFLRVRRLAQRRQLMLLLSGSEADALSLGAAGVHRRNGFRSFQPLIRSAPAHDVRQIRAAERAGADLIFLSPAFETRSHPSAKPLGVMRFLLLARHARQPVIALGGINERRARRLGSRIYGWAAIDAWLA